MGFVTFVVDMGIIIGKVIVFIVIMMLVGCCLVLWIMVRSVVIGFCELFILLVLVLVLGVVFGVVELFDVFFVLGVFFVGMVLNEFELSYCVVYDMLLLCDVFVVLFFVFVGMLFDLLILI